MAKGPIRRTRFKFTPEELQEEREVYRKPKEVPPPKPSVILKPFVRVPDDLPMDSWML